jgi:hypothetical protein
VSQVFLHACSAYLVFLVARRLDFSPLQSGLGSLIFLLAQGNVITVLSVDTFSGIGATLFGMIAIWLVLRLHVESRGPRAPKLVQAGLVVAAFLLSLLSKESSVALLAALGLILLALPEKRRGEGTSLPAKRGPLLLLLLCLLATAFYLGLRAKAGATPASLGAGQYQFRLSVNVLSNLGMLLAAALTPVSTVSTFVALERRDILSLLPVLALTVLSIGPAAYGLWRNGRIRLWLILALLALILLFPMLLLNHVSELYVYGSMPFIALLLGAGWGAVVELLAGRPLLRFAALAGLAALLALNALAIQSKARLMAQNGDSAESLLTQLAVVSEGVPAGGRLLLVNPPPARPSYSVYYINGFDVLEGRRNIVNRVSGRNDFSVKIAEAGSIPADFWVTDTLAVTLVDGKVVAYVAP